MYLGIINGLFLLRAITRASRTSKLYWVVLCGLFLFSAFRFRVGCDWDGYYLQYLGSSSFDYVDVLGFREPLWWFSLGAISRAGVLYPWINVITSVIFFVGIHAIALRQPDRLGFLVLLFPILIINIPMSGIRQGAAIGVFCFALLAFMDRRLLRFVAWTLLASTIHTSAMVFLLLTPLAYGKRNNFKVFLTVLLSGPALFLLFQSDGIQLAVERYVDSDTNAYGAIFRVAMLTLCGLYFLLILRNSWTRQFPSDLILVSFGSIAMIGLAIVVPVSTVIADRFGYYLIPIQAMIFARIPYLNNLAVRNVQAALPYLVLLLIFTVWSMNSRHFQECYVPYQTWLFGYPMGAEEAGS